MSCAKAVRRRCAWPRGRRGAANGLGRKEAVGAGSSAHGAAAPYAEPSRPGDGSPEQVAWRGHGRGAPWRVRPRGPLLQPRPGSAPLAAERLLELGDFRPRAPRARAAELRRLRRFAGRSPRARRARPCAAQLQLRRCWCELRLLEVGVLMNSWTRATRAARGGRRDVVDAARRRAQRLAQRS